MSDRGAGWEDIGLTAIFASNGPYRLSPTSFQEGFPVVKGGEERARETIESRTVHGASLRVVRRRMPTK